MGVVVIPIARACLVSAKACSTQVRRRGRGTVLLFQGEYESDYYSSSYDVAPDGQRFVMIRRGEEADTSAPQQLNVVLNWFEELKRLVRTDN